MSSPGAGLPDGMDRSDSALLETLLNEAPVAFAFYDTQLRYRRINRALAETNGLPIEAHLGRRPSEILPGDLGAAVEEVLRDVLRSGQAVTDDDFTAQDGQGRVRHWQSAWYPARDAEGQVLGVAVLVTDVTDRRRAEVRLRLSHHRTERLQRATAALARALTLDDVVNVLADIGKDPVGAAWAGLAMVDGDMVRYSSAPITPVPSQLADVSVDELTPTTEALRSGTPVYLSDRAALLARFPMTRRFSGYLAAREENAWAVLPLRGLAGPRAALRLAFEEEQELGPDERIFLEALAGQCALALERARTYERERRTAAALQASLLPARLPAVPGLSIAARFRPAASADAEVGGDWYDVYALPDGTVAVVVGDVMGKGVVAAAGMGRVRSALRALSMGDPSPPAVLSGLDLAFSATEGDEQLVTLIYAVIDPATGRMTWGGAGHPPLLLVPGDGGPSRLLYEAVGGTPLGLPEVRRGSELVLAAGDTVLGFSDGLLEERDRDLDEALGAVSAAAVRLRERPVGELIDGIATELTGGYARDDDVTILAVRRAPAP